MPASELDLLIATRRDLHRHPELAFEERRTAAIVAERLRAAGYEVRTGIAETGVVGTLRGGAGEGRTLLLRADMDALPIEEASTHDFVSTIPGRMHACGHDGHVAVGLAVAERLAASRDRWGGRVAYLFQPAEEGAGGALRMIQEGVLDGVDAALGLHFWLSLPSGEVGVVDGPLMASSRDFHVTIRGRGGHGAMPQDTIDATLVGSHAVTALHSIVSRSISPLDTAVISVGSFHAGTAANVIAEQAVLHGTIRAFRAEVEALLRERIAAVLQGVCAAFGAGLELTFSDKFYPATVNDPAMVEIVRRAAVEVVGESRVHTDSDVRTMAAEDFSEFSARVPGCYFFVGARDEATGAIHPHQSPRFDLCERALPVAVDVLERAARAYLSGGA